MQISEAHIFNSEVFPLRMQEGKNFSTSVKKCSDYYAFGLVMPGRSSNSANPNDAYKFTGYELDDEAGLTMYHANARGYDPVLGRFMQIDPAKLLWSSEDIMRHNLYGLSSYNYVRNNPLIFIDPTGFVDWKALAKGAGRTVFGVVGVVGGIAGIVGGTAAEVPSLGTSTFLIAGGIGATVWGTTETAFGIADIKTAWETPDGFSADSYGTLVSVVAAEFGASETAQSTIDLVINLVQLKGSVKIGELLVDDKIIQALIESGGLADDIVEVLENYQQEYIDKEPVDLKDETSDSKEN